MRKDKKMNTKPLNKRKSISEIKHHIEPKLRKKDNVESLTKQALLKRFKELEDKYLKVVSNCEELKQTNESLRNNMETLQKQSNLATTKSVSGTQTVMLSADFTFPCQICVYNADSEFDLRIHMEYVHDIDGFHTPKNKCNICNTKFRVRNDLMSHIKEKHGSSLPSCKYFQTGTCKFNEKSCWFVHKKLENPPLKCRYCEERFFSKSETMNHQKFNHEELIPICKNHVKGHCKFKSKCWFQHSSYVNTNDTKSTEDSSSDSEYINISTHETSIEGD